MYDIVRSGAGKRYGMWLIMSDGQQKCNAVAMFVVLIFIFMLVYSAEYSYLIAELYRRSLPCI